MRGSPRKAKRVSTFRTPFDIVLPHLPCPILSQNLFLVLQGLHHQVGDGFDVDAPGQLQVLFVAPSKIFQGEDRSRETVSLERLLVLHLDSELGPFYRVSKLRSPAVFVEPLPKTEPQRQDEAGQKGKLATMAP